MFLVPYRKIQIDSTFTVEEAIQRILQAVEEESVRRNLSSSSKRYFRGSISPGGFRLVPIENGRKAYAPSITGYFAPGGKGTIVNVTFSGLLPLLWLGLLMLLGLYSTYSRQGNLARAGLFSLVVIFLFHVSSYYFGFLPEMRQSESLLRDLLGDYR